jgi:hypothetical protein
MPPGIALFLVYALLILFGIGAFLPAVVGLATNAPITFTGLVVMVLLAYTIFTTTLVLQRKQAARAFALGLTSLTLPAVAILLPAGRLLQAIVVAVVGVLLLYLLTRPAVSRYLNEP